jgi:hypothetical protein
MRDKLLFAASSIAVSLALFGLAAAAQAAHFYSPTSAGFTMAAASVVVSALGVPWSRKAAFLGVLVGVFAAFDLVVALSGLRMASLQAPSGVVSAQLIGLASLLLAAFPLVLPLAVLAVLVGRDPAVLWTRVPKPHDGRRASRT